MIGECIYLKKFLGAIDMTYIPFDTIDNIQEYIFNEPKEQFEGYTTHLNKSYFIIKLIMLSQVKHLWLLLKK